MLDDVRQYYEEKLHRFGTTSRGVDWKDEASQLLRFEQLAGLFTGVETATVLDFGCGYGALQGFIAVRKPGFRYYGYDVSTDMLAAAQKQHQKLPTDRWLTRLEEESVYDYVLASGVFNVRLDYDEAEWDRYVETTLELFNRLATKGFAFNMLTSYSDPEKRGAHLYFADPSRYFMLCKTRYARYVTLAHDYPLYEFTILVKKQLP